ncbi:MAG: hypothetical protein GC166_06330 [Alphaproteobacteria bacterium]|nr:hypothetical protein [Alphaproteobacteria bacterium]
MEPREFVVLFQDGSRRFVKAMVRPETDVIQFFTHYFNEQAATGRFHVHFVIAQIHELTLRVEGECVVVNSPIGAGEKETDDGEQEPPLERRGRRPIGQAAQGPILAGLMARLNSVRHHAAFHVIWSLLTLLCLFVLNVAFYHA